MYLTIGQSAKLIGVSVSTIRNWEAKGQLKSAFRTPGGHRRFKLEVIYKVCGFLPKKTFERPSAMPVLAVMTKKKIQKGKNPPWKIIVKKKHPDMK